MASPHSGLPPPLSLPSPSEQPEPACGDQPPQSKLQILCIQAPLATPGSAQASACCHAAFQFACRLVVIAPALGNGALPDIHPGALPRLQTLLLQLDGLRASLPASWGASPAVLPSLQVLDMQLGFAGTLPAAWAAGFPQLRTLDVTDVTYMSAAQVKVGWQPMAQALLPPEPQPPPRQPPPLPAGGPPVLLPVEWAAGFGRLQLLRLLGLGIQGSLPEAWVQGGFPALQSL